MPQMYVIGEDALSCALGTRLATVLGWSLAQPAVNTGGVTKLKPAIPRYVGLARIHPVLCVADTDGGCAGKLRKAWLPARVPDDFLLRLAVKESESWLLADHVAFAGFLDISDTKVPDRPDEVDDAKRAVLNLARRSRKRPIRQEVISAQDPNKPGAGYNVHLCDFVSHHWRPREAAKRSPSLARALRRLTELGTMR